MSDYNLTAMWILVSGNAVVLQRFNVILEHFPILFAVFM